MSRISRKFRDISLSFARNPVTNDILSLTDADAIKKSVVNLVRTRIGERFFNSLIGTNVEDSIFELQSVPLARSLQIDIENLIKNFEPRVKLISVDVNYPNYSNELNIVISYNVVGLSIPAQTLDFVLQPTRV